MSRRFATARLRLRTPRPFLIRFAPQNRARGLLLSKKSHADILHPRRPRQLAVGFTPAKYCGGNFYTRLMQIAGAALEPIWSPSGLPQAKKIGQYGKSSYLCTRLVNGHRG